MSDAEREHEPERQRQLWMSGHRRSGRTTALLDIAIGNARRGEQVAYWCAGPERAQHTYRLAAELLYRQDDRQVSSNGARMELRWPNTERGSITFGYPQMRLQLRGFKATVVVNDEDMMPAPEPIFAHTVITGDYW